MNLNPFSYIKSKRQVIEPLDGEEVRLLEEHIRAKYDLDRIKNYDVMVPRLFNKEGFHEQVSKSLSDYKGSFAVVYFDGDHFKSFNDQYGHDVGDEAIKVMGRAILDASRKAASSSGAINRDILSRQAGDEFCVLLMPREGYSWDETQAEISAVKYKIRIMNKLSDSKMRVQDINGEYKDVQLSMTGGLYIGNGETYEKEGQNVELIIKKADTAMNLEKSLRADQGRRKESGSQIN